VFVWNSHEETFSSSGIQLCLNVLKGISIPLPALPELKDHKINTLPSITRSALWGTEVLAFERHPNSLYLFKCCVPLKRHEIISSHPIYFTNEKSATFADLVIRLGFQSL
jgi:hypothetical protein